MQTIRLYLTQKILNNIENGIFFQRKAINLKTALYGYILIFIPFYFEISKSVIASYMQDIFAWKLVHEKQVI